MKKITMFMMTALIAVVLAACGTTKDTNKNNADVDRDIENGGVNTTEPETETNTGDSDTDRDNGVDHNGEERLDLADDAADKIAEMDEVDYATVILSNNNAYVAVVMDDHNGDTDDVNRDDDLSDELKDKITEKVKEVKTDVDHVYVSASPDFAERMKGFGTRIEEGEPIKGFFEEFGEAVRNVFPDAR